MASPHQPWPWFAILTRGGREKHSHVLLEKAGYECFLPVCQAKRKWSDRIKKIQVPLFPGYLFCRMNPAERLPVLMTPGVLQIVGVGKTPVPVAEDEVAAIERLGRTSLAAVPWPYVEVGEKARIVDGPLKGVTGIVVRLKSQMKLVLSVSLLQRSVAVELERQWLEGVTERRPASKVVRISERSPMNDRLVGQTYQDTSA